MPQCSVIHRPQFPLSYSRLAVASSPYFPSGHTLDIRKGFLSKKLQLTGNIVPKFFLQNRLYCLSPIFFNVKVPTLQYIKISVKSVLKKKMGKALLDNVTH